MSRPPATSTPPASYLRRLAVFGGLNPQQLGLVRGLLVPRDFGPGELLCEEGESAGEMFVLLEGEAEVVKRRSPDPAAPDQPAAERVLHRVLGGDCVGEMSLLDCQPRSASVRALTPCRTFAVTWDALLRLYERDLLTYTLIMMNLAREVTRRLRIADRLLADFPGPSDAAEGRDAPAPSPSATGPGRR